jgi:predicted PurR-regulated permease PerM
MSAITPARQKLYQYAVISAILFWILYHGQSLFVPMLYGLFIAIVLYPVCRWLERHFFSRAAAIGTGLLLVILLFGLLVWALLLQVNALLADLPALKLRVQPALQQVQQWLQSAFNISIAAQDNWWKQTTGNWANNSGSIVSGTFSRTASALWMLFVIPVFAALFLYNRQYFVLFLKKLAGPAQQDKLQLILQQTIHTYFHFIKGMGMVYVIVGLLNSIGLLALGIDHAILFGFLTAVMTIIPYFGIFISASLPVAIAWITKDSIWYPLGVIMVFVVVQYAEANIIFPRVVAAQLNISTWATLVAIVAGGILWGVNGMILFIPFAGMLKMITDHFKEWEAVNILLSRNKDKAG